MKRACKRTCAYIFGSVLLLSCLLFSGCQPSESSGESESGILEEIRTAPVVKLEFAEQPDNEPIFADNAGTTTSLADMRIIPADEAFTQEWIYRFTYNPQEKVINGHEIIVLFGASSLEIDGVTYMPEEGVSYDSILEWAEGVYKHYSS